MLYSEVRGDFLSGHRLVLVEWEDSAQPISQWMWLSRCDDVAAVHCYSVGWLVNDGDDIKAIAPNVGFNGSCDEAQVCGVIQIPARCIVSIKELAVS